MARAFDGVTAYISLSFTTITAYPFTLFIRGQSADVLLQHSIFQLTRDAESSGGFLVDFLGTVVGDPVRFYRFTGDTRAGTYIANTDYAILSRAIASNNADCSLDSTTVATSATVNFPGTSPDKLYIGGQVASNVVSSRHTGNLSQAAVWNVALDDAERDSLAKGFSPRRIRPQSLKFYAPLVRDNFDWLLSRTFNDAGTSAVNHPRVYGF